jgi:hypothetical protein
MTDAGEEFYRHAVLMLREAELAETAIRHRLNEPKGTVRCTAAVATMRVWQRLNPSYALLYSARRVSVIPARRGEPLAGDPSGGGGGQKHGDAGDIVGLAEPAERGRDSSFELRHCGVGERKGFERQGELIIACSKKSLRENRE